MTRSSGADRALPDPAPDGAGESVWDYPRPPAVDPSDRLVVVRAPAELGGGLVARTHRALRVLETSHPPTWYVPRADVVAPLRPSARSGTVCEFKGRATYWDVVLSGAQPSPVLSAVAWSYEDPRPAYAALAGALAFYPSRLVATVAGEAVRAQEGDFYGGWITGDVVGPFKGGPGTWGW